MTALHKIYEDGDFLANSQDFPSFVVKTNSHEKRNQENLFPVHKFNLTDCGQYYHLC